MDASGRESGSHRSMPEAAAGNVTYTGVSRRDDANAETPPIEGDASSMLTQEVIKAVSSRKSSESSSRRRSRRRSSRELSGRSQANTRSRKVSSTTVVKERPSFVTKMIKKLRSPRREITTQIWYTKSNKQGPQVLVKTYDGENIGRIDSSEHLKRREVMTSQEVLPPGRMTVVLPELEQNWRKKKEELDKLPWKPPERPGLQNSAPVVAFHKLANHLVEVEVVGNGQRFFREWGDVIETTRSLTNAERSQTGSHAGLRSITDVVDQEPIPMRLGRTRGSVSMPCMPKEQEVRDADVTASLHTCSSGVSAESFKIPHRPVSPRKFGNNSLLKSSPMMRRRAVVELKSDGIDMSMTSATFMCANTTNSIGTTCESKVEAVRHPSEQEFTSVATGG